MAASVSVMAPAASPDVINGFYLYAGTDAVAEGETFAFDASHPGYIKRMTASTDLFAGVAARDYPADSGARQIELNRPGSRGVKILLIGSANASVSAGTVFVACYKDATGGSKVFKAGTSPLNAASGACIGCAIVRENATLSASGTGSAKADLAISAYASVSES